MTKPQPPDKPRERTSEDAPRGFIERRRERMRAEIRRNREGNHRVPTWVMAVALILLVGTWLYFVITV
ncbi:hypothetical protein AB0M20_08330 [Actinoplanes sp. NPDC051633]|uniref:hypothetical protein n=1 Tax=Actinoplanes sp. NPDC051633 TaxID=3155670 RepID=UPI0034183D77